MTIIYHSADYDGQFSGAICSLFLGPEATLIGWDYGDPLIPFPEGDVYLVDLSPDCFESVPIDVTARLVWIDHHKSNIQKWDVELGYLFKGYRIDGVAACRLCWQWFSNTTPYETTLPTFEDFHNHKVDEPEAVRLVGEYDVWDKRDPDAETFQYGLVTNQVVYPENPHSVLQLLDTQRACVTDAAISRMLADGAAAQRWHQQFASSVCKQLGYRITFEGLQFWVLASIHSRNSLWFKDAPTDVDALMNWRYSGDGNVRFSLYHAPGHEEHDLSPIAVKYGGGGHRGACGFQLPIEQALPLIRGDVQ